MSTLDMNEFKSLVASSLETGHLETVLGILQKALTAEQYRMLLEVIESDGL